MNGVRGFSQFALRLALGLAALVGAPAAALSDPAETLGLGFDGRSTAGAVVASDAGEWSAVFYNPANLGLVRQPMVSASALMLFSELMPDSARSASGTFAEGGFVVPVWPFGSLPIFAGMGLLMPASSFYEIDVYPVETISYALYNSRERRLSLSAGLGARITSWLALGASVQMLPTVAANVDLDLADATGPNTLKVHVEYRLNPIVGVTLKPLDNLTFGLVWRGVNKTWLDLPVKVDAEGINLEARIQADTFFVPHRVTLGARWRPLSQVFAEVDLSWHHYSEMDHPSASVQLLGSQGQDTLGTRPPESTAHDIVSASVAAGWSGPLELTMGYRFFPNPFDEATQRANLLSGNEHLFTLGARVPLVHQMVDSGPADPDGGADVEVPPGPGIWLDASLFAAYLSENRQYKELFQPENPGFPSVQSGGLRYGFSLGVEARY